MRIICTVTNDLTHDQRMNRICTTLQEAGHEVSLVGRELPDSAPLRERSYRQHRIRCRYHTGKRFYAEFNFRVWRELRSWNYDVICAVDLDTLLPAYFLTRGRARLVYDAHEWFSETPEVVIRPVVRRAWRTLGRTLVPRADARYTVASVLARKLEEDYGVPFDVVRNLPFRKQIPKTEKAGGVILYQGMLNPGRGVDTAIEALSLLSWARLWIVGDGPERPALEALAQRFGVADQVWFAGFVSPDKLPELTHRAWLGINLLAGDSPNYYYSLANKALDYVQASLPSIQMDYPEYRAINEEHHCFQLLPTLSAAALAALLVVLQEDTARYAALRSGCELAADVLCWEAEAPKLLAIYRTLELPTPSG